MIKLSDEQVQLYVPDFVKLTMLNAVDGSFNEGETADIWALFDYSSIIVTCGLGSELTPRKVWLSYFAVHPDYRGAGLGTGALKFVEREAIKRGYEWIYVETYEHELFDAAIKLYLKNGYQDAGRIADYLEDDSDKLFFRKKLI